MGAHCQKGQDNDMSDLSDMEQSEKLTAWVREQLHHAVNELMERGAVDSLVVEAKPAWTLPYQLLIGKIRESKQSSTFEWFICGDAPLDHVHSSLAVTPRDAARHFSLKWQLEAARQGGDHSLAEKAEALYELVDMDALWEQASE